MSARTKTLWRYYQRYIRSESSEQAAEVLADALSVSPEHFMKLASRYGADHGRLPDNLHAAVVLLGGELSSAYLENLSNRA